MAVKPSTGKGVTPPKGSSYTNGTWRGPRGNVIGHAPVEDAPIARAVPGRAAEHYGPIQANTRRVGGRTVPLGGPNKENSATPNLQKMAQRRLKRM